MATPLSRRRFLASAAAVLTVSALGACGSGAEEQQPAVGYGADRPAVTLDFWYMPYGGPIQDEAVRKEAEAFHQQHPNITVNPVRIPWDEALTRLATASTSGSGPDVTVLGTTWVGGFSALGALRPYTGPELTAVGGKEAFAEAAWSASHRLGSEEITAMPWLVDVRAMFYRTDVLAKTGVPAEEAFATWESFEATLQKIKDAEAGVAPLAIGIQNNFGIIHNVAPFVWGAGGDLLNAGGTRSRLDEPGSIDAVTFYQSLLARYDDPEAMKLTSSDVPAAFADGVGAVTIDNSQSVADYLTNPDRPGLKAGWATAPIPAGRTGRHGFIGGSTLAILKSAKHPDAAFEWVRYLTSKESQQRYGINAGLWPSRTDAVAGTRLATHPAYAAFRTMLEHGRMYPSIPAWITVESVIAKDLAELWNAPGVLTRDQVAAILRKASDDIDAALADPEATGF